MKSFKTNRLIFAVGAVLIGIILLIWPGTSLMLMGKCIGAALAVGGVIAAFLFWKDHETPSRSLLLVMAAIMLICGVVIFLHPDDLVRLIPTIMGILVVISGLINIGETFLLNRQKYGKWWISLLVAAVTIVAGLVLIHYAFQMAAFVTRIAGGVLIFDGASDLWVLSRLSSSAKNAAVENGVVDADATEVKAEATEAHTTGPAAAGNTASTGTAASTGTVAASATASAADAGITPDTAAEAGSTPDTAADTGSTPDAGSAAGVAETVETGNADTAPAVTPESGIAKEDPVTMFEQTSAELIWNDDGVVIGSAETEAAGEMQETAGQPADGPNSGDSPAGGIPEYMLQNEQPGEYRIPGQE